MRCELCESATTLLITTLYVGLTYTRRVTCRLQLYYVQLYVIVVHVACKYQRTHASYALAVDGVLICAGLAYVIIDIALIINLLCLASIIKLGWVRL